MLNNAATLGFELCLWSFGMFFFTSITSTGIPSLLRNATRPGGEEEEVSGVERQQVDDGEEESEGGNMEERVWEKVGGKRWRYRW